MPEPTLREQLEEVFREALADQEEALKEAVVLLGSDEVRVLSGKIAAIKLRTLPNSHCDQLFATLLQVIDSTKVACEQLTITQENPDDMNTHPEVVYPN